MSFTIEIASVPDREGVVAEIWWNAAQVAELRRGTGNDMIIEIYPAHATEPWSFDLGAFLDAVGDAKARLS